MVHTGISLSPFRIDSTVQLSETAGPGGPRELFKLAESHQKYLDRNVKLWQVSAQMPSTLAEMTLDSAKQERGLLK